MQQYDQAIPILPSRSIEATTEFYLSLGFEGGPHEFNSEYGIFCRGAVELHFFKHPDLKPAESSAGCYIRVLDVESVYRTFLSAKLPEKGIPRMEALEAKPWGLKEFALVDCDGNLLRIGQLIEQ